jgi:hypothetical protein
MDAHSPFTIRLELLKLAQSIENDRIWTERNRLEQDWHATKEEYERKGATISSYPKLPVVTYEDVIRVAEHLNRFVSCKG